MVKPLPTLQEMRIQSLGREDLLEKEMATHFSTLAWKIPWTEKLGRLQSMDTIQFITGCVCVCVCVYGFRFDCSGA